MRISGTFLLASVALSSCVTAGCQKTAATNGSGYSFTRFADAKTARLVSEDPLAGPSISSNNIQCRADPACRK